MKKTIFVNKKNGNKFELIDKNGQLYTLKNEQNEIVEMYRIQLNKKYYDEIEIDVIEQNDDYEQFKRNMFNDDIKLLNAPKKRKNKKHECIKIVDSENVIHDFKNVNEFANYLMSKFNKQHINKGHLYNLINGKTKSYLQHKLYVE